MRLVRLQRTAGPRSDGTAQSRFGVLVDDAHVRVLPPTTTFADALDVLRESGAAVDDAVGEQADLQDWVLLAPVPGPASLRDCVGFFDHIRNTRRSRGELAPLLPVWHARPGFYFANPWSLRSATDDIAIPAGSEAFDFELEIAAVIGRGGRDLTSADAAEAIAGYVLFCDWSARDIQAEERTMQIGLGKGKDAAISLGPWILSAQEAASVRRRDGLDIEVTAKVNDEVVTDPDTRYVGMNWTFEEIVAYASVGVDLVPGDVIAVGTVPTGCLLERSADSDFRGWLSAGDHVHLSAGPLGDIRSTIRAGAAVPEWRLT